LFDKVNIPFNGWNIYYTNPNNETTITPIPFEHIKKINEYLKNSPYLLDLNEYELLYKSNSFDLIISRNKKYNIQSVNRVIKRKGFFIIQQTSDLKSEKIWSLNEAVKELESNNFEIIEKFETYNITKFTNVGEMIYFLENNPWNFRKFKITTYSSAFEKINNIIQKNGFIRINKHYFFIIAQNKKLL